MTPTSLVRHRPSDAGSEGGTPTDAATVLAVIGEAQRRFLDGASAEALGALLEWLVERTGSSGGAIAETVDAAEGVWLAAHARCCRTADDALAAVLDIEVGGHGGVPGPGPVVAEVVRTRHAAGRDVDLPDAHGRRVAVWGLSLLSTNDVVGVVLLVGALDEPPMAELAALLDPGCADRSDADPVLATATMMLAQLRSRRHNDTMAAAWDRDRARIEKFMAISSLTPDFVSFADADGKVETINQAGLDMLGYQHELRIGQIHTPWSRRQVIEHGIPTAIAEGRWIGESEFVRFDGSTIPVSQVIIAPKGPDGRTAFMATIARDISATKEVERMRHQFIATVSHELRTPLTSLRGSLGLLGGGVFGELNPDMHQMLKIATTNVDRLIELVNDILDLERLGSETSVTLVEMDPHGLLSETVEVVQGAAVDRDVRIGMHEHLPVDARIIGDRARLRQALVNLAGNAVKFSPPGARVSLSAAVVDDEWLVLQVADEGPGIPPEDLDRLFEPFVQLDTNGTTPASGSGLGLAIVRRTVEIHLGEVAAVSDGVRGARFEMRLPLLGGTAVVPAGVDVSALTAPATDNGIEQRRAGS